MIESLPLLAALLLGAGHAFEADHVAAVTAFAARRPGARESMGFGLRWALGHGAMVIAGGALLLAAAASLPAEAWLERLVGASLVALGAWTVLSGRSLHAHRHTHADGTSHVHLHGHVSGPDHDHGHAATAVGLLHGLAGTAPAVALLPLVRTDSAWLGLGYLAAFAVGTAAAMALYALLAGAVAGRVAVRSARAARALSLIAGAATAAVGVWWMAAA